MWKWRELTAEGSKLSQKRSLEMEHTGKWCYNIRSNHTGSQTRQMAKGVKPNSNKRIDRYLAISIESRQGLGPAVLVRKNYDGRDRFLLAVYKLKENNKLLQSWRGGKQGWCSGESARLLSMWPGFDARSVPHAGWVCRCFSPYSQVLRLFSLRKTQHLQIPIRPG